MAVGVALLKFCSQAAVYVTAKVLAGAGITADLKEGWRRYGRKKRTMCLCGVRYVCVVTLWFTKGFKFKLDRAQSSVAKEDDVRHSATKEMAISGENLENYNFSQRSATIN